MKITKINNILNNTKEYIKNPDKFAFGDIALDLYDLHRLHNKNYKKYSIGRLDDWHQIPLVPSYEFSKRKLQLSNFSGTSPNNEIEFLSKNDKIKHHNLRDTEFLRTALSTNFCFNVLNMSDLPTNRIVFIIDKESNSLLSYICEYLSHMYDFRGIYEYVDPTNANEIEKFILSTSSEQFEPLILVGTPNLFYQFKLAVDTLTSNPIVNISSGLPTIIQFGDYIEISKMDATHGELNDWLTNFFHTSSSNIVQVYYNTELSSQLFRWKDHLSYFVPHTVSVRIIDPTTGKEQPSGIEGNLAFIDVANVWSCPFIISDDLGIMYNNSNAVQITRRSDEVVKTGVNPQ
jgi:hypothetical protein